MSKKNNLASDLKARVLGGTRDHGRVDFSKPLTTIEEATAANEAAIAQEAKNNTDEGIDNNMIEVKAVTEPTNEEVADKFDAEEAARNIGDRVDAEVKAEAGESTVEEVESLNDLTSAGVDVSAESQRMNEDQFAQFMAKLKEAGATVKDGCIIPAAVTPTAPKHSLIVLPANLELETPEELTRLMKNVQSKKCRSKAMGRKVEYEDSLVAEAAIKAARELQGGTTSTGRAAELPEDLSTLPLEEIIRNLKNVQSKKCMAKAMGRTEIVANMVALEDKLKIARDMISPKAGSYHMLAKGVIIAKVEELRTMLDALIVDNDEGDNDDAIKYNETFIEALEWAMSATLPNQEETAK